MQPPPRVPLDAASFPAVLVGAQRGEGWAAETLFVDLQPRLLRFLRSTEPRMADDLAGEVWLAMAGGLSQFDGDLAGFRAWMFTIARRRLADHRRTAGRRSTDPFDAAYFEQREQSIGALGDDTATLALASMSAQQAADLIAVALPPDQAEVLLLRVLGDLDVAQVAAVLDRTANWVRVTQHRALRRLAEKFPPRSTESVMHGAPRTI